MKICYFTATGNSLYVARRIGGNTATLLSIPELMKSGRLNIADNAVGIVCPVYSGDMPKMVRRFLEQAAIETDYFFMVYTFGFMDSSAKPHAVIEAKKDGLALSYVSAIKMIDNYLPGFEIENQKANVGKKHIEEHIDQVRQEIAARKKTTVSTGIGAKATIAFMEKMESSIMKDTAALDYLVNDRCIQCGICAKVCPADNIMVTDHVEFGPHCEVCYACLHNCPQNAIHLKNEKSTARFRNEHVKLNDIIAANR